MRVLALQLKRIGDLVLTLPAFHALKAAGAHVTLALAGGAADLLPALGDSIDDAVVYRSRRINGPLWARLARGGFDACVDFTGSDRSALLALASRAGQRVISRDALRKRRAWRQRCYTAVVDASVRDRHTVDYYLDHLAALGVAPPRGGRPAGPTLRLPPEAIARARSTLAAHGAAPGTFAVVHPGSARAEKYWQPERWAAVIDFSQRELALPCVLTGGRGDPLEDRHLTAIHAALAKPCLDLAGKLDLLTLAAVLAEARLFLGVDSGPMHLAAAWDLPQVVLFGPTNPFHWRPRGAACLVLQPERGRPLADAEFRPGAPGGPTAGISTAAVIGCITQLARAELTPRRRRMDHV